jgi:hypothetical protein
METIKFRIREHRFTDGVIRFFPERTIERKPFPEGGPDWINVGGTKIYFQFLNYENALNSIKEFLAEKGNLYEYDIIHNLPEFTITTL